jgi:uncharacterized membrane protein
VTNEQLIPEQTSAGDELRAAPIGPARVLAIGYGFFTLAAGARSAVQLTEHPSRALFAYVLSAIAAVIYLLGTVLIAATERSRRFRAVAVRLCLLELAGVVIVGTVSVLVPAAFTEPSVWSWYGSGYGFVPAVLPLLALWWLHRG